jgi:endonuclease/exonuclease/phosphatase family metal-dependent hydrolase
LKIIGPGALLCCVVNFFPLSCGTSPSAPDAAPVPERVYETIRISSFNIQIFGAAKMAKPGAAEILAGIVSRFDITAVQEVRSVLIDPVERFMALLPAYSSVLGPREGRTSSREQYWVIYDTGKFTVLGAAVYPDPEDVFERNPLGVFFAAGDNFDFILINNHIRPGAAAAEIDALPEVIAWFQHYFDEPDALVVGDFNADGSYYDETLLASVFPPADYEIIISNQLDTTVASSDNTYDRFIITRAAREDYTGNRGVLRFDDEYALGAYGLSAAELSDHYPIWAEFYLGKDTD